MDYKAVLLLVSAILVSLGIFAEAGCTQSKNSDDGTNNEEGDSRAVQYANSQENPLGALNKPLTFESNDGETMTIECIKGRSLSGELLEWVKSLLRRDSEYLGDIFVRLGCNSETRFATIREDTTLLIVRSSEQPVGLAYLTFELDLDEGIEIVYLWDLLIEESMRNRGVESYLLNTVMDLATHFNMRKITLSVFERNTWAMNLYKQHGFRVNKKSTKGELFSVLSKANPSFHK